MEDIYLEKLNENPINAKGIVSDPNKIYRNREHGLLDSDQIFHYDSNNMTKAYRDAFGNTV